MCDVWSQIFGVVHCVVHYSALRWELDAPGRLLCQMYRINLVFRFILSQSISAVQSAIYSHAVVQCTLYSPHRIKFGDYMLMPLKKISLEMSKTCWQAGKY